MSDSVSLPHIVSTLPKDLTRFLFDLCELRYCVHNIPKIISPTNQNLLVLTANDKITWWSSPPKPPVKNLSWIFKVEKSIAEEIWGSYHKKS